MLPDGKLTEEHHQGVRDLLDDLILDANGKRMVSFVQIGKAIGKTTSVVSQWYGGSYSGNMDGVTRAINRFVETSRKRQQIKGPDNYIPTWMASQMIERVRLAHNKGKMAAIVAPAGSGKSIVIEYLAEEFDGFTVYCDATLTPKQFLARLATSLHIKVSKWTTLAEIMAKVVSRLDGRQTIIFIDEAQLLNRKCGGVIRSLHDQTKVTIAMFGSQQIFGLIDDRDASIGGGQFWRRCHKVDMIRQAQLLGDGDGNAHPLFSVEEVRAIAKAKDIRLANDGVAGMLARIACIPGFGTMGLVCDILEDILYLYDGEPATVRSVTQALLIGSDVEAEEILGQVAEAPAQRRGAAS